MRRILATLLLSAIAALSVACTNSSAPSNSAPSAGNTTNSVKSYPDQSAPTTTSAPPGGGMGNRGNGNSIRIKPPTEK